MIGAEAAVRAVDEAASHHERWTTKRSRTEQSTRKRTDHGNSSATPATKRHRTQCSAQVPTECSPGSTIVAYITCDMEAQDFSNNCDYRAVLKKVTDAINAGAEIVNIAFKRTVLADVVNTSTILTGLKELFPEKGTSSVGQPAYSYCHTGSII